MKYRVTIQFEGGLDYVLDAENVSSAKHQAMMKYLEETNFEFAEIVTARPAMVENLTTGEVEYEEDM